MDHDTAGVGHRTRLIVAILITAVVHTAMGQGIVVSPEGPVRSISEAIRQVEPGGQVTVRKGTYREATIEVDKPVTIIGEGYPVLDGEGDRQLMTVTADSVTIRGLEFRNVGVSFVEDRAALKADGVRYCRLESNRFINTFFGIYLARTSQCRVANNVLQGMGSTETRSGNGIHLWYSKQIEIANNTVKGHRDGIYFEFVEDSSVMENVSEVNLRYGLHFMFSDRCKYHKNIFRGNDAGVAVMYTDSVEMIGNRFEHNWGSASFGLLLKDITDSRIQDNHFVENTVAVYAEGSNRIIFERNDFVENGWAVRIMGNALDNVFMRNNFIGNAFDVATNSRRSNSRFEENFWDAYRGYDLDRDGYGDVPFRPVRLFSLIVEKLEPALILLRSPIIGVLDTAERVLPSLTPETLADTRPSMRRIL